MTVRPKPNPNLSATSRNKSYHNDKLGWQRIVIALQHPDFKDQSVIESLQWLMENGH